MLIIILYISDVMSVYLHVCMYLTGGQMARPVRTKHGT